MKEEKNINAKVLEKVEKAIESTIENGVQTGNADYLYKLVDIHKDIYEEEYYKSEKEEKEMYRDYGDYSGYGRRGVPGSGRGRYRRYRGEDALDEMKYHYGNYMDSGNYGEKEDSSMKMINCFKEFGFSIAEELEPKDKMMFKKAMQEVMQQL